MWGQEYASESRSDDGTLIQFEYNDLETDGSSPFDLLTTVEVQNEKSQVLPDFLVNTAHCRQEFAGLPLQIMILRYGIGLALRTTLRCNLALSPAVSWQARLDYGAGGFLYHSNMAVEISALVGH